MKDPDPTGRGFFKTEKMKTRANNIISKAFGRNFTGSPDCPMTIARKQAVADIIAMAGQSGVSVDSYITQMLVAAYEELCWFIKSNGEVPVKDAIGLAAQATLLRADEVATITKALDISDDAALAEVETAEYDAYQKNIPDACVLSTSTQAALYLAMLELQEQTGTTITDFIGKIKSVQKADNFTMNAGGFISGFTNDRIHYNNADPGDEDFGLGFTNPYEVDTKPQDDTVAGAEANTDTGGGFNWSSIGDIFKGINDVLSNIKGTSTATGGVINGILNNIKGTAAGVGSTAIQDALTKKLPLILGGILVVAIIVIIIAKYAGKSK